MGGNVTPWIAVVVGAVLSVGTARVCLARMRARHGTRVTGTVMSCESRSRAGGLDGGPTTTWSGHVRFRDPGTGEAYEDQILFSCWRAPGSEVPLCYPRQHPEKVEELSHWAVGLLLLPFFMVGLIFFLGGLVKLIG